MTHDAPHVLLVQVRRPDDPMALHEHHCIRRRLHGHWFNLRVHNAFTDTPSSDWLRGVDAMIIGGSGSFGVYDAPSEAWLSGFRGLIEGALVRDVPSFGICFGHQILGYHLGSRVEARPDKSEVGTVSFELTDAGASDPLFGTLPRRFVAQTGHGDHVVELPQGAQLLARNEVLDTQAFRVEGSRFFSAQFHPDLSGAEARERWLAVKHPHLSPEQSKAHPAPFREERDHAEPLLGQFLSLALGAHSAREDASRPALGPAEASPGPTAARSAPSDADTVGL
jgi:GMP synthase (glutamine-hydrolysing)